ncbi:dihydrofolate reductase family protein [Allonocardiopsis opalescens]|uniref:Dihydrofolate reductase n=1 Tax=Allonocardiopsis opalescens TaxID=1144618 RepID=A0A2T0Q1Y4_9ACTN|nr:dihydrofolate reductase family protein [Allonocardiopsis opalescens]PRX97807.1 dihydrofolate reductase [Allonocardiopsis opalescens]
MRKLVYAMSTTLDGYVKGRGDDISWSGPDDELMDFHNQQTERYDTSLYGRGLYENMASYWPHVPDDPAADPRELEFARAWLKLRKVVFSTTLESVEWNSTLVRGDIVAEVARLKAMPGRDMDLGGATLAASFIRLGLVDEFQTWVHPVVLGGGTPFLPPLDSSFKMRLIESRTFRSGVVYLRYEPVRAEPSGS